LKRGDLWYVSYWVDATHAQMLSRSMSIHNTKRLRNGILGKSSRGRINAAADRVTRGEMLNNEDVTSRMNSTAFSLTASSCSRYEFWSLQFLSRRLWNSAA
jgi:hypothetical protein